MWLSHELRSNTNISLSAEVVILGFDETTSPHRNGKSSKKGIVASFDVNLTMYLTV